MVFEICGENLSKFFEWDRKHSCELKEYSGACGGRITYSFTPTSLGVVIKAKCACGEELDLTDYKGW